MSDVIAEFHLRAHLKKRGGKNNEVEFQLLPGFPVGYEGYYSRTEMSKLGLTGNCIVHIYWNLRPTKKTQLSLHPKIVEIIEDFIVNDDNLSKLIDGNNILKERNQPKEPLKRKFEYDFVISYAGEDENYAEQLRSLLLKHGGKVFFAPDFRAELWGENLYEYLHEIYSKKAYFCIIIVSKFYVTKQWTRHEWRSAQERALQANDSTYILPIRLDNAELPGLPSNISYLDATETPIDRIASFAMQKLNNLIRQNLKASGRLTQRPFIDIYLKANVVRQRDGKLRPRFTHLMGRPPGVFQTLVLLATDPGMLTDLVIRVYLNQEFSKDELQSLLQPISVFVKKVINRDDYLRTVVSDGKLFMI